MKKEEFASKKAAFNDSSWIFPEMSATAQYYPACQLITFNDLVYRDFLQATSEKDYIRILPMLEVIRHELTHWADSIGTLWGQYNLKSTYEAIHSMPGMKHSTEYDFWRMLRYQDEMRRMNFPKYYTLIAPDAKPSTPKSPWGFNLSCGAEFDVHGKVDDSRPIIFARFLDPNDERLIARQPITVGSLLETTATWSELSTGLATIAVMYEFDQDSALVEASLWSRRKESILYNPELTEYTAPAHLLANQLKLKDIMIAYRLSAALAHLVLNLPDELFKSLRHPATLSPFGERLNAFLECQDRGYAFAALAHHAPTWQEDSDENIWLTSNDFLKAWLESTLSSAGLPNLSATLAMSKKQIEELPPLDIDGPYNVLYQHLKEVGETWFNHRAGMVDGGMAYIPLNFGGFFPRMMDAEFQVFSIGPEINPLLFDPEYMFNVADELLKETKNFITASRLI